MITTNISQADALKQPFYQMVTKMMVSPVKLDSMCRNYDLGRLRNLLLQGAQSAPSGLADEAYFASLRSDINSR